MSWGLSAAQDGAATLLLVAACLLLGLLAVVLLAVVVAGRRRTARALAASRADLDALHARLDAMAGELEAARVTAAATPAAPQTEYVITTAGAPGQDRVPGDLPVVAERAVLSATVGEPLVKAAAFVHGLRRALSPESRNRIAFEMRREVKRARKERRRAARRSLRDEAARTRTGEEAA